MSSIELFIFICLQLWEICMTLIALKLQAMKCFSLWWRVVIPWCHHLLGMVFLRTSLWRSPARPFTCVNGLIHVDVSLLLCNMFRTPWRQDVRLLGGSFWSNEVCSADWKFWVLILLAAHETISWSVKDVLLIFNCFCGYPCNQIICIFIVLFISK